jgi:glycosyltransferase involved in cell wall biosynthesis
LRKPHKQLVNIFQLISSAGYFGAENVLVLLSAELGKSGFFRPVIGVFENLRNPHLEIIEKCREHKIETNYFRCRGKFDFRTIIELRKFIQQRGIDIVHSHGYKANVYSFLANYGLSTMHVATCHNWLGDETKMKFYAALDRFFLRRFDKVIAVSENIQQKIIKSGVSAQKVTVIQNGILLDRFDNCQSGKDIRKELGITHATAVIGTVGRLSSEKGHRILLMATEAILEQYPGTVFIIVGDGPLRRELEREFNSPSVIFTGIRNDVPCLYRCMDFFVLPSFTEGFPMVILEAMASKLPVVATRVGEVPSLISRENGILAEPGDVEGIKQALLYLLRNRAIAKGMGEKGYQRVKDHLSSEKMAKNYMGIYRDIVNMGQRGRFCK